MLVVNNLLPFLLLATENIRDNIENKSKGAFGQRAAGKERDSAFGVYDCSTQLAV